MKTKLLRILKKNKLLLLIIFSYIGLLLISNIKFINSLLFFTILYTSWFLFKVMPQHMRITFYEIRRLKDYPLRFKFKNYLWMFLEVWTVLILFVVLILVCIMFYQSFWRLFSLNGTAERTWTVTPLRESDFESFWILVFNPQPLIPLTYIVSQRGVR